MTDKIKHWKNIAEELSDDKLIEMCNEIFEWKHHRGILPDGSSLRQLSNELDMPVRTLEEYILNEASHRFKKLILLLMLDRPYIFLNTSVSEKR